MNINFDVLYERLDSRWNCDYPIKKFIHRDKFYAIKKLVPPNCKILDVGRGGSVDGVLGVILAKEGYNVTISNIDQLHIDVIKKFANTQGVKNINFIISNPEDMIFEDNNFDMVLSLHTLEHANSFYRALSEINRVTKKFAIIALPTCYNSCVAVRLGGGQYYDNNPRNILAKFKGMKKILRAKLKQEDFVIEKMDEIGNEVIHKWFFPNKMRSILLEEFEIIKFGADCLCFSSSPKAIKISKLLGKYRYCKGIRNFGMGSHALLKKEWR